jgi:predicted acyl esterase
MRRMNASRLPIPSLVIVVMTLVARLTPAAEPAADTNAVWLAEHYTKYEHRIPMRDGVRLFTRVYVPKDDSQPWPISSRVRPTR